MLERQPGAGGSIFGSRFFLSEDASSGTGLAFQHDKNMLILRLLLTWLVAPVLLRLV